MMIGSSRWSAKAALFRGDGVDGSRYNVSCKPEQRTRYTGLLFHIHKKKGDQVRAIIAAVSVTAIIFTSGCDLFGATKPSTNKSAPQPTTTKKENKLQEVAVINTRHGEIVLKLFPDVAKAHVASFKKLSKDGFYNKTTFHRVIPGFMIQGGDPNSKNADARNTHGTGGPGYELPAEFSDLKHKRGILSAARSQNPDSAGSQFFICVADALFLDGQYTVFGEVVSGMDVADKIVNEPKDGNDNPNERVEMTITIEEREI